MREGEGDRYQAAAVEADYYGSLSCVLLLGNENVCSDFVVVDLLVGGLDEVQAG